MMYRLAKIKFSILLIFLAFFVPVGLGRAQIDPQENCDVLYQWFRIPQEKGDDNAISNLPRFCTAQETIVWIIERLLLFAGSIAVIFLIIGGFRYLTAAGNEEVAEKGKKTLVTSIIGLAVILLAGTIVRVVANTLGTGNANSSPPPANSRPSPPPFDQENQGQENQGDQNRESGWRQATPEEIETNKRLQEQGQSPR